MDKVKTIEEIQSELFCDAHLWLVELELLYKREYKKDLPFDNWLRSVILSAFKGGVFYTSECIKDNLNVNKSNG